MQSQTPRILAYILAHNEESAIGQVVQRVRQALPEATVLVVDDGSMDNTARAAREAGAQVVSLPFNLGIGGASQTGQIYAIAQGYDIAVRLDGDGQYPPAEIHRLLDALAPAEVDMVVGSRFLAPGGYKAPFLRRIGIRFFSIILSAICRRRVTDPTSGFIAAKRPALTHLARIAVFDFPEIESLVSLSRAGFHVIETPVSMAERAAGTSSINLLRSVYYVVKVLMGIVVGVIAKPCEPQRSRFGSPS